MIPFQTASNAALMELNIPVTQGKAGIKPGGALNDRHGKAVELAVGYGRSAYPGTVQATQAPEVTALLGASMQTSLNLRFFELEEDASW